MLLLCGYNTPVFCYNQSKEVIMLKTINSGKNAAEVNMELDQKLLEELHPDGCPILHFYDFQTPAATYGVFLKPENFLIKDHGLNLAKRPTGGGILFHIWDLTFSVLIPKNHFAYSDDVMKNYKCINDLVLVAISQYLETPLVNLLPENPVPLDEVTKNFCFAKPTKYDVMIDGKKVAGAAQRRKNNGFLHQGSISVVMPDFDYLEQIFPKDSLVVAAMKQYTYALTDGVLDEAKEKLRTLLQKVFAQV